VTLTGSADEAGAPSLERIAELVRSLASVMCQSGVTELDLELGTLAIRLRRPMHGAAGAPVPESTPVDVPEPFPASQDHFITAPMIGTFYASPAPGAPPFVTAGSEVYVGQTVGIIEAMKIMNEITADRAGVVDAVLVDNGQPVEYGSPLLRLNIGLGDRS
jgi:acetyl-CoA carboxylase biotin carboxyl carrier protein